MRLRYRLFTLCGFGVLAASWYALTQGAPQTNLGLRQLWAWRVLSRPPHIKPPRKVA